MFTLSRLKKVDPYYKYAVFGYIRDMEEQLKLPAIPTMISYICLSYYCVPDHIATANQCYFTISNNKMTLISRHVFDSGPQYSAQVCSEPIYLHRLIDSMSQVIVKWTFRMPLSPISVGIMLYPEDAIIDDESDRGVQCYPVYEIQSTGHVHFKPSPDKPKLCGNTNSSFGRNFGGLVEYTLDLRNATFRASTQVPGTNELRESLMVFDIIKKKGSKYRLFLVVPRPGVSVTLTQCVVMHKSQEA